MIEQNWYIVRTFSGHEKKVKTFIDNELKDNERLRAKITDVLVPAEEVYELKNGKKKKKMKNFLPGYILVQADLDLLVKDFICNTPSVMGFLGGQTNPSALLPDEVKRIVGRLKQDGTADRYELIFRVGDFVKIIEGPFNNFTGVVEEVNEERSKIKVLVSIFGRKTPVELEFTQAELHTTQ